MKKVVLKYQQLYWEKLDVWQQVQAILTEDVNILRRLNAFRNRMHGNQPKSQDSIDVDRALANLSQSGGENI